MKKIYPRRGLGIVILNVLFALSVAAQPALPPRAVLSLYEFADTNWLSVEGDPPLAFTNLVSVPRWNGNALWLDTTNLAPAYLAYDVIATNGSPNINFSNGVLQCVFVCDWASADTNQFGNGPGDFGYLLAAGDFSSNSPAGLWALYFDPAGTNVYFGGVSNGVAATFVSAPISWASNSIHAIALTYSTNTVLYIDGQLAATGGPVSIVPDPGVWTNGFYIGSDNLGYEQGRGTFWYLELANSNWFAEFTPTALTNWWPSLSNIYANFTSGGSGSESRGGSLLSGGGSGTCVTGTNVYLTNMASVIVPGYGNMFSFTIAGGQPGYLYDVFATTNLPQPITNAVWTWLGQGTNCGNYIVTNQPGTDCFYMLGMPQLATDGSGLTVAYERLIGTASDGHGTPNLWYVWQGLSPVNYGVPAGDNDFDGDGLLNYQEYLWGSNPTVSEGFGIWVSEPEAYSEIP